ncbi:DUF4136 domain-containing protein [Novosphingopyxis sp.]|uniref:DUF4136 domain-containing protein n=1 Tax=Novosphingopyxis sp. TaxID=2709690 RepID=UPI003B5A3682
MPRILAPVFLAAAAAASLSACMTPAGPVEVTRFHRAETAPVPRGTISLAPLPSGTIAPESIEARTYYDAVAAELSRLGYTVVAAGGDYRAEVDAQRGTAAEFANRGSGVSVGAGGSTGTYGSGVGLGVGLDLTRLLGGDGGPRVITELDARILRASDSLVVWEGRAQQETGARTEAAQLNVISRKLAGALFQGFPGNSGETIRVK